MSDEIRYFGYAENGREVELWLGDAFNSHVPSRDEVEFRQPDGTYRHAYAGQTLSRDQQGWVSVR